VHAEESLNSGTLIVVQCVRSYPPIANLLLSFLFKRAGLFSVRSLSLNERGVSMRSPKPHSKLGGPGKAQGVLSTSPATVLAPLSENEPVRF